MKFFAFGLLFTVVACQTPTLILEKTEDGTWVIDNGKKVLFYQARTKSLEGQYPRANYVHPLYGIDGFELTDDFPNDHLHHRGIFWTWHQVFIGDQRIGDGWECKDFIWDVVEQNQGKSTQNSVTLNTKTLWKSPLWKDDKDNLKAFLREESRITVHSQIENYRIIDFEISLLALEPDLKLGGSEDEKGYGGFSVRMKMPEDMQFEANDGVVEPQTGQVVAGAWMNMSGALTSNGGNGGIVIICNSENPLYPEKWILRKTGSMQNPVFPGREPVTISDAKPTILKYRLVVYSGALSNQKIKKLSEDFS